MLCGVQARPARAGLRPQRVPLWACARQPAPCSPRARSPACLPARDAPQPGPARRAGTAANQDENCGVWWQASTSTKPVRAGPPSTAGGYALVRCVLSMCELNCVSTFLHAPRGVE